MKKIKHFISTRKIFSTIIVLAIALIGYLLYTKLSTTNTQTNYVVSKAKIGNVEKIITGTGQVSALSQLDIKSKSSGNLVYLNTSANGQKVKKGDLIAQVDTRDVLISLENAKINYAKLVEPADEPTLLQTQRNLEDAIQTNTRSYSDAFAKITDAFISLPSIINGLDSMLYQRDGYLYTENVRTYGSTALELRDIAGVSFDKVKNNYNSLNYQYKDISINSSTSTLESFVSSVYQLSREIADVVKKTQNSIDFVKSQKNDSAGTTAQNTVSSWTNTISTIVSNLLSTKNAMSSSIQNIYQQRLNLNKILKGATDLEIASQDLQMKQVKNNYEDYFIRAPFDGILARLSVKPTDTVSNGTTIGTIVSEQKILTITLNEIDVTQVNKNQKVKVTFDAIPNTIVEGRVVSVDLVGTVSQGIVNYNVEIFLSSTDERIRSGMSASASIITESKENVLIVPNSAIKSQKNTKGDSITYVETFDPPLIVNRNTPFSNVGIPSATSPQRKTVQTGLIDDNNTEIISGLNENDQIVIKTNLVNSNKNTNTASNNSSGNTNNRSATGIRTNTGFFGAPGR